MVSHVLIDRPRHDLEKIPMEWRRDTFSVGGACAGRMYIVSIDAGAHDGFESCKGIAAFRPPSFVRGQVAGNNMRERPRPRKRTEVSAATQVGVDRKSTRLNSSHTVISYAVFCLKKKKRDTVHELLGVNGRQISQCHRRQTAQVSVRPSGVLGNREWQKEHGGDERDQTDPSCPAI